ncbi:hypothetical protein [uncultured Friedmanniella sp.]|uniref:hypothetical protein n=1 Tax=uncultured Friedmanniella sp. TaxID=335381 RepID=UPI0035CA1CFB
MRPLLPAVAATTVLVLAAVLPSGRAAETVDCTPVIDTSSISLAPRTLAVTATGYQTLQFSAAFTAACGEDNGSDLDAAVIFSSPDLDGSSLLEASDGIYPSTDPHSYGVSALDHILSGDLENSFAGTWTTEVSVTDTADDSAHSYDDEPGPTIRVLRAAKVTATATPEPVEKGHSITVTGALARANWDTRKDGPYAKRAVKLQFRTTSGTYATVKTVTSTSKGKLHATVAAQQDGYYRYAFVGSSTTARAISRGDFVDVS